MKARLALHGGYDTVDAKDAADVITMTKATGMHFHARRLTAVSTRTGTRSHDPLSLI